MVSLARKNLLHDRLRFVDHGRRAWPSRSRWSWCRSGLFMGLLDKATVTIEHASADIWVTSRETPNVDFAHTFPETNVLRVRGVPGVERADNLIVAFMNIQLPTGAEEGCLVYALEDFAAGTCPGRWRAATCEDLRRGSYILMDRSAERRFGPFAVGDYREILGRRFKIIGTTTGAASFTTAPIVFMDYGPRRSCSRPCGNRRSYVLVKAAPGRRRAGGGGGDPPRGCPTTTSTRATSGRGRSRALLGGVHRPGHEHGRHRVPGRPGRASWSWPRPSTPRPWST